MALGLAIANIYFLLHDKLIAQVWPSLTALYLETKALPTFHNKFKQPTRGRDNTLVH